MYLIKVNEDNYINIDKIVKVSIDRDNDSMYVFTSDMDAHEVLPEYRPVIQSWLNVADERTKEDKPTKRKNNWGDGIEPLCVKGIWSEGIKVSEENKE